MVYLGLVCTTVLMLSYSPPEICAMTGKLPQRQIHVRVLSRPSLPQKGQPSSCG
jgi:hypothetical protein